MTIEELRAKKLEYGLTIEMIAERSGVPLGTLQKIFSGVTKAPRKQTLEAIEHVIAEEGGKRLYAMAAAARQSSVGNEAGEAGTAYAAAGQPGRPVRYTLDDYYAIPDEQRVELIDGVFYDMASPSWMHQMILGELHLLFRKCTDEHDAPCEVWLSPCDVRLDRDNYTMVQPDLFVCCNDTDTNPMRKEGAPDLVIEILSPSTRSKDMILKLYKYQNAGVREYWIVDPLHKTVTVHYFEDENYDPVKYSFADSVPVRISDGTCSIDFSVILKKLESRVWD